LECPEILERYWSAQRVVLVVLDTVTVFPHVPRDVKELNNEQSNPLLTSVIQTKTLVIGVLNALPVRRNLAKKEGIPANGVLILKSLAKGTIPGGIGESGPIVPFVEATNNDGAES
jgi:hypothetical protein